MNLSIHCHDQMQIVPRAVVKGFDFDDLPSPASGEVPDQCGEAVAPLIWWESGIADSTRDACLIIEHALAAEKEMPDDLVREIRELRKGARLGKTTIRELINEGRR